MGKGVELGVGYISLAASTGQLGKDVRAALKGIDGDTSKAADKAGKSWTSKVGGAATKAVKGLGIGVGAVAATLGGLALHGGIERALKIEGAQAKLKGLGHDTKTVDAIMQNAMASVKGTAFGLGEAATTAAGAVAAGIKPGGQLEGVLKSVANSAAAAGVGMDEMGGIYNKVASLGKAQNDVLQQVADKGIPIYQALGEQMGMTADEVFDAASKGKIGFDDFQAAMTGASGTVAEEMGKTLPGKIANFRAALSRLGEKAVSKALPYIASATEWATQKFDEWGPVVERVGDKAGKVLGDIASWVRDTALPALRDMGDWLRDNLTPHFETLGAFVRDTLLPRMREFGDWIQTDFVNGLKDAGAWIMRNKDWLMALAVSIGTVAAIWAGYTLVQKGVQIATTAVATAQRLLNLAMSANPIGIVITAIAALVAGLIYFFTQTETGKKIWADFTAALVAAWERVRETAVTVWTAIADFFTGIWGSIVKVVTDHVTAVRGTIAAVWGAVKTAWETVWNGISSFFAGLWAGIKKIVTDHVNAVSSVISFVWATVKMGWETVWGGISSFFSGLWAGIKKIATDHINAVRDTISFVVGVIKTGWERLWGGIRDFASSIWGGIKKIVSDHIGAVRDTIDRITGGIKNVWDTAWSTVKDVGKKAWDWISGTAETVFGGMKSKIEDTFKKLSSALDTIWSGIKAIFAKPINAVIGFINKGIIGGYNWVAEKIGIKTRLSDIPDLPGYADGGWTGPGGKYKPAGVVHADEYVLTKKQVRAMGGPSGVADWLSHAGVPGYAGGGLVTYQGKRFTAIFAALLRKANEMAGGGMHISQGGFRPRTSYSGTSHQGDAVDITGSYRKFIAPLRSLGIPTWDRAGKGKWVDHAHGVPLPGSGSAAGSAVWQAQDYLRGGDGLSGRDNGPRGGVIDSLIKSIGGAIAAGFNSVQEWFSSILEKITGPFKSFTANLAGGPLGDLVKSVATKLMDELTSWVKDKLGVGYANGTRSASPGLAWVGERGPELVRFRGGEQVIPNHALGGGGVVINGDIHLPEWIRTWDDAHAFLTSPGLAARAA